MIAQERRHDIFTTEQDCLRLVELAKVDAKDNLDLALKASALSEAKSQKLITSAEKQLHKKIARITSKSNKTIEKSQMEFECLQQDCIQATEGAIEAERTVVAIKTDHAIAMKFLKTQHKYVIRDTQARHVLRFDKQKLSMTNEMNSLRDLIFGQNQMIDGCLLEMQDARRAVRLASSSAHQQKSIASNLMAKIKLWKGKYEEM